jgi:hypothetical protein
MSKLVENEFLSIDIMGMESIPKDAVEIIDYAITLTGLALQPQIVIEEPIDQGFLRESTQLPRVVDQFERVIEIEANYWRPVHFGVRGTNRKPNPFIDRAIATVEPRIEEFVQIAIDEVIR